MSGRYESTCPSELYMICKNLDGADQVLLKCDLEFLNIESAKSWITKIQPGQASFVMAGEDQTTAWTDFVLAAEPLSVQTCSHGMYEYSFREHTVRIPENIHRSFLWARQWGHLGPERAARYSDAIQRALIMLPFIQSARNTISADAVHRATVLKRLLLGYVEHAARNPELVDNELRHQIAELRHFWSSKSPDGDIGTKTALTWDREAYRYLAAVLEGAQSNMREQDSSWIRSRIQVLLKQCNRAETSTRQGRCQKSHRKACC